MLKKIINKLRIMNNIINSAAFQKDLQINTYCNSLLNNLIDDSYLPRTAMSLNSFALAYILNEIIINRRNNIIEFGSGISTILMAKLAYKKKLNIKITSIDEDKEWIVELEDMLSKENLKNSVKFIHSPIINVNFKNENYLWYDEMKIANKCGSDKFDIIIVDGPKTFEERKAAIRYHALNFMQNKLKNEYVVFLDDAKRKGEMQVLTKWKKEFDIKFEIYNNLAVAYKGKYFFSNPIQGTSY